MIRQAIIVSILTGTAAQALTPLPPCDGMEAGMNTYNLHALDPDTNASGVTVESYQVDTQPDDSPQGVYRDQPAPVPALDGFYGVRVTHCASGTFHAIEGGEDPFTVAAALAATEFLRPKVKAGQSVGRNELASAIRAVYGKQLRLKETEETCGCSVLFPDLKPKGMTPFENRTDTVARY
ncbi:hypothetical protein [Tabrizicola sp.]|uniref:hypothetical protein n=1 Tax=Tabrizicola sp. TaxID=2005166 RepID=UPI003F32990E